MKNFGIFIFIALTLNASSQQITKAEIIATGLTCSMCSNAIYKQLKATDGVDSVKTDLNKNMFIVFLSETRNVSPVVLKEKIEKAGFFVGSFEAYFNFSNTTVSENKQIGNYIFLDAKTQKLNGIAKAKILSKGFVTVKEFKKLQKTYVSIYEKESNFLFIKLI